MHAMVPGDADTATAAYLPRDVLSDILLRLPAFHLRGLRRVCKEWRDIISSFVDAYRVHGRRVPTHTVVFSRGSIDACWRPGCGFLFDEHWRFAARFTVDQSARLIGTCNSLLFFLIEDDGVIKVVEPFTGETITVPPSPARYAKRSAYCVGFDSRTRQYKIVHGPENRPYRRIEIAEQVLYVFTVGADKQWRTVCFACALHGYSLNDTVCSNGVVHWRGETRDWTLKYVRFDLTTEEITSVDAQLGVGPMQVRTIYSYFKYKGALSGSCDFQIGWFGEWEDDCWPHNITAMPHKIYKGRLGQQRLLPKGHALQRGHLLLQEKDGSLYAHEIQSSSMTELYLGREKLIEIGQMEEEPTELYKFIPVHSSLQQRKKSVATDSSRIGVPIIAKFSYEHRFITTFAYTPTLYLTSAPST